MQLQVGLPAPETDSAVEEALYRPAFSQRMLVKLWFSAHGSWRHAWEGRDGMSGKAILGMSGEKGFEPKYGEREVRKP